VTLDEAFAAVSHAFPSTAHWQGRHFVQANRNGVTIIEVKKSSFRTISTCPHCGQTRDEKDSRFFYWLIWEGQSKLIHASLTSRFKSLRTIGESIPSLLP
jgi:hypothetical protein